MSSLREGIAKDLPAHSLSFRVMRLCKPTLHVGSPLTFQLDDISRSEDDFKSKSPPPTSNATDIFAFRCQLHNLSSASGLSGLMMLPQSFGSIHLGETFRSYVSVGNHSKYGVSNVVVKADLQTERQRIILMDTSRSPIQVLEPSQHEEFVIEHDVKELGPHTLICSATYFDHLGEQRHLPQFFKFSASNPISVRTKVRVVKSSPQDSTFLEASIENSTKDSLYLDTVRFEPASGWLSAEIQPATDKTQLSKSLLIPPSAARAFLFSLVPSLQQPGSADVASSTLGRLAIEWRGAMGEKGRIQTQNIFGTPVSKKEVELRLVDLPGKIRVEEPFPVVCRVTNHTERVMGPLEVTLFSSSDSVNAVSAVGLGTHVVQSLEPHSSTDLKLSLVALNSGVQKISGISVKDGKDGKPYDTLPSSEIFVEA